MPRRSVGLLTASLEGQEVVFDPMTLKIHLLNWTAALVLEYCDGITRTDQVVSVVVEELGASAAVVRREIEACLRAFDQEGLLERAYRLPPAHTPLDPAVAGNQRSLPFAVPGGALVFRSADTSLIRLVDDALGCMVVDRQPTIWCGLSWNSGRIQASGTGVSDTFASAQDFLNNLPTILSHIVMETSTMLVLHAGAVASEVGTLLLPGPSGTGKSTLTAALLKSGAQYLSDDAVGIQPETLNVCSFPKPIGLSVSSRRALGLETDEADQITPRTFRPDGRHSQRGSCGGELSIVLPTFTEGASTVLGEPVPPLDALRLLAPHATNLAVAGQRAFDTLVALAKGVPTRRLVHGDALAAARLLV